MSVNTETKFTREALQSRTVKELRQLVLDTGLRCKLSATKGALIACILGEGAAVAPSLATMDPGPARSLPAAPESTSEKRAASPSKKRAASPSKKRAASPSKKRAASKSPGPSKKRPRAASRGPGTSVAPKTTRPRSSSRGPGTPKTTRPRSASRGPGTSVAPKTTRPRSASRGPGTSSPRRSRSTTKRSPRPEKRPISSGDTDISDIPIVQRMESPVGRRLRDIEAALPPKGAAAARKVTKRATRKVAKRSDVAAPPLLDYPVFSKDAALPAVPVPHIGEPELPPLVVDEPEDNRIGLRAQLIDEEGRKMLRKTDGAAGEERMARLLEALDGAEDYRKVDVREFLSPHADADVLRDIDEALRGVGGALGRYAGSDEAHAPYELFLDTVAKFFPAIAEIARALDVVELLSIVTGVRTAEYFYNEHRDCTESFDGKLHGLGKSEKKRVAARCSSLYGPSGDKHAEARAASLVKPKMCAEWLARPTVSPYTLQSIAPGSEEWRAWDRSCGDPSMRDVEPPPQSEYSASQCAEWRANPSRNPDPTAKRPRIAYMDPEYVRYSQLCGTVDVNSAAREGMRAAGHFKKGTRDYVRRIAGMPETVYTPEQCDEWEAGDRQRNPITKRFVQPDSAAFRRIDGVCQQYKRAAAELHRDQHPTSADPRHSLAEKILRGIRVNDVTPTFDPSAPNEDLFHLRSLRKLNVDAPDRYDDASIGADRRSAGGFDVLSAARMAAPVSEKVREYPIITNLLGRTAFSR